MSLQKAALANGPLPPPTNLNNIHHRNLVRLHGSAFCTTMTASLLWLWFVRIPNSEQINRYMKHVDLKERYDAMREWGVFSHKEHHTDWQKAHIAKLRASQADEEDDE